MGEQEVRSSRESLLWGEEVERSFKNMWVCRKMRFFDHYDRESETERARQRERDRERERQRERGRETEREREGERGRERERERREISSSPA